MAMTADEQRRYDKKREEMLAVMRQRGGSDSAFDEELPESVQAAMRKRRARESVADERGAMPERAALQAQDDST